VNITLTLPYPVSANRYWRSFVPRGQSRAIVVLSDEAKAYKQQVGWMAHQAGIRKPIAGRVQVEIWLYPQRPQDWAKRARRDPVGWDDTVQCLDLDNANKVLLDALKGVAIEDDRWVHRLVSSRMEPDGEGRVVLTITSLMPRTAPQLDLLAEAAAA
jgi:crossover junction endodeoxyribonuclease RusA